MEPTGHWACLSAGRKGSPAAGRTTARSKASVARALMATAKAIDVDRRSLLLLGRCFLAPTPHDTGYKKRRGRAERVGTYANGTGHEDQDACCASFACAARPPIQAASQRLTQPRAVRRHRQHSVAPGCKFRDYRRWSRRGGLDEPEPEWLASTEDTDEVDAHHACG